MTTALLIVTIVIVTSYLLINLIYLINAGLAARDLRDVGRELQRSIGPEAFASPLTPGVSIIVPTRNEEAAIIDTVQSLLGLRYPRYEILIVDGGSTDRTRERVIAEFDLVPAARASRDSIPTGAVGPFFVSTRHPDLWLMCKPDVGKADALNAGLNTAQYPYYASVDGDGLLEEGALLGVMEPILADPRVIGSGGMIRAVNGSRVEHGRVFQVRFPPKLVARLQVEEYLRSFLLMRTPLSGLDSVMIISGAFGLFRRDLVEQAGGYFTETAADDVEVVIHLHRRARDTGEIQRVVFLPAPACWTEVPDTWRGLLRQRRRWHRGIAEALWRHRGVFFRPRYGRMGWLALPYLFLELTGPPIELLAWAVVLAAALLGILSVPALLLFLAVSTTLNLVFSIASITLGEVEYRRHVAGRETSKLLGYAFLEVVGYRQLVSGACVMGLVDFIRGRRHYVQPERRGHARQ